MPRTVKALKRVDEADAANESMALAVDKWWLQLWSLCGVAGNRWWPRRLRSATWPTFVLGSWQTLRVRNLVAPNRPGTKGCDGDAFLLLFERKKVASPSKTHNFDGSVILDRPDLLRMGRLWQALIVGRPGHARLIPMDQNEIAREVKTIFEELGCGKPGVVAYIQSATRRAHRGTS